MKSLIDKIYESSESITSLIAGFATPSEFKYSSKCKFSKEEVDKLIKLIPHKNIKIAKSGSIMFDFSTNNRVDVVKFIHNNDRYIIRRASQGMGFFTKNGDTVDEHPVKNDKNSNKYWFDTFDEMYEYAKGYIAKRLSGKIK